MARTFLWVRQIASRLPRMIWLVICRKNWLKSRVREGCAIMTTGWWVTSWLICASSLSNQKKESTNSMRNWKNVIAVIKTRFNFYLKSTRMIIHSKSRKFKESTASIRTWPCWRCMYWKKRCRGSKRMSSRVAWVLNKSRHFYAVPKLTSSTSRSMECTTLSPLARRYVNWMRWGAKTLNRRKKGLKRGCL